MPTHNKKAGKLETPPQADAVSPDADPRQLVERGTQDVQSVRSKSAGHGKTADKWSQ